MTSLVLYLNDQLVTTNDDQKLISKNDSQGSIKISWPYQAGDLFTVIVYDINSRNPSYVHLLAINVPNNDISKGLTILSYESPNPPPGTGRHIYIVDIYKQSERLSLTSSRSRDRFDVNTFASSLGLNHIGRLSFSVNSQDITPINIVNPVYTQPFTDIPTPSTSMTENITPLSIPSEGINYKPGISYDERKYCNCLLKVQNKQGDSVNPYAICAHVGDRTQCGAAYDYVKTSDDYLTAFAELHQLPIPMPYNRRTMLDTLDLWKRNSGEPSIY